MSTHFSDAGALPDIANDVWPHGKRYAYYTLFLLALLYCFDFMDRMIVSSLFVPMHNDIGISTEQFGLLTGIVNISIAVLAFPSALLVDRWSRKNMVGLMALLWGVACLLCAFAGSFYHLLILRFVVGAGEAGYGPGASTILQSVFPPNKRNGALGILQAASPLGVVAGMVIGGVVAQYWGWRHAFGLVAVPGIIVSFLVFFLKEPPRAVATTVNKATGKEEKVPLMKILVKIFKTRTLVLIFLGMAMALIFNATVGVWIPSFFHYTEGIPLKIAGLKGAGVMGAGAVGAIVGGMVADRLGRLNASWPLRYAALTMFLAFAGFYLAMEVVPNHLRYTFLLIGGFFLNNILGITYNAVLQASSRAIRATSLGCLIVVQNIFGMALGASLSGFLASHFRGIFQAGDTFSGLVVAGAQKVAEAAASAPETVPAVLKAALDAASNPTMAYGIQHAMSTMAATTIVAGILFFLASMCYTKDCEGAECFE